MVICLTRDVSRTLRHALNPRTPALPVRVVQRLLKIVFVAGGLDPREADARLSRSANSPSSFGDVLECSADVDWALGIDRPASSRRLQAAELICRLVYTTDFYKKKRHPDLVFELLVEALVKEPLAGFESRALQSRYGYAWLKKMLDSPCRVSSNKEPKILIDRILKVCQASPARRSRELLALAIKTQLELLPGVPLPVFKQVVNSLPYATATVIIEPVLPDDSKTDMFKKFRILEFPIPLVASRLNPREMVETLLQEFPWMTAAIAAIEIDLWLGCHYRKGVTPLSPKLLVGEPGCGKTTFAGRVGELLGQPKVFLSAAGAGCTRLLLGTVRGWSNARPCFPIEMMAAHGVPNLTICVDELDKESPSDHNGRFSSALLGFLEPTSAKRYFDEYLFTHCNLRNTSWIATANDPTRIPAPVLSRFTVIDCPQPAPSHMPLIADNVVRGLRHEYRLGDDVEVLDDRAQAELAAQLRQTRSAREVTQLVRVKFGETLRRRFSESNHPPSAASFARPVIH